MHEISGISGQLESLRTVSLVIATLSALGKMRKTGRAANLIKDEEGDKRAQLPHGTEGLRIGRVGSLGRS